MATKNDVVVPPLPPTGQIVTDHSLLQVQYAEYRNSLAFSGVRDPSMLWSMMQRNDASAMIAYRELEDKDDDISGSLDELKLSVMERAWDVLPGDDSQAAADAADFIEQQLNKIDIDSFGDALLDAAPYGYWVGEMSFDVSAGQASLLAIDDCPQELFLFGNRFQPQIGPMQYLDTPYASQGVEVPEEKFIVFTYRGRSRSRMGRPLLKRCFWLSWFKRQTLGMWLKCANKNAGTAIAKYAASATDKEKEEAIKIATALLESDAIAVPDNLDYDTEMLKSGNVEKPEIYERLFEKMQYSIARAIKGETLTSFGNEGGKGSRSQGQTHSETFEKRSVSLTRKADRCINMQLVRPLHLWNYGPDVAQPIYQRNVEETKDQTAMVAVYRDLQSMGLVFGEQFIRAEFDIPALADGDTPLVPNTAIAPAPTPTAAFSERTAAQRTVNSNYDALDTITAQLKREAIQAYAHRVREVADALEPTVVKKA